MPQITTGDLLDEPFDRGRFATILHTTPNATRKWSLFEAQTPKSLVRESRLDGYTKAANRSNGAPTAGFRLNFAHAATFFLYLRPIHTKAHLQTSDCNPLVQDAPRAQAVSPLPPESSSPEPDSGDRSLPFPGPRCRGLLRGPDVWHAISTGNTRQPFRRCRLLVVQEPPERRQTGLHCLAESTADLPVTFYLSHTPSL